MDDYIKRGDILGTTRLLDTDIVRQDKVASWLLDQILYDIEHTPAADAAPVIYAEWELRPSGENGSGEIKAYCTKCGKPNKQYRPPYCPHCGSKMHV